MGWKMCSILPRKKYFFVGGGGAYKFYGMKNKNSKCVYEVEDKSIGVDYLKINFQNFQAFLNEKVPFLYKVCQKKRKFCRFLSIFSKIFFQFFCGKN